MRWAGAAPVAHELMDLGVRGTVGTQEARRDCRRNVLTSVLGHARELGEDGRHADSPVAPVRGQLEQAALLHRDVCDEG